MSGVALRRGDLVEVRGAGEILATLDDSGCLGSLPFMAEMVQHCGRRFHVDRRAEKVCDTINRSMQSRRLADVVFLDELRCDGSGHGQCQADCRFYWKEAWLRRVSPGVPPGGASDPRDVEALCELLHRGALRGEGDGPVAFRCQVTEMVAASTPLSTADPRPYVRELTCGNVTVGTFVRIMSRAAVMQPLHRVNLLPSPPLSGRHTTSPPVANLDLQAGEWVRVRSREEIEATLTTKGTNRGLWFDREMLALCGQVFRVRWPGQPDHRRVDGNDDRAEQ